MNNKINYSPDYSPGAYLVLESLSCFCTYWLLSQADFWSRLECPPLIGYQVDSLKSYRNIQHII